MKFYETFEFLQTFYEIGKLVKRHSKRACEVAVFIFLKINKEFLRAFFTRVEKNVDYMENLKFSSRVEISFWFSKPR